MVRVTTFTNETEAFLARDYLMARDIRAEIVGAKEYTAHIMGGGAGRFELMVEPLNLKLSTRLLEELQVQSTEESPSEGEPPPPPRYLQRSVFYALLASLILPLVFNYASIRNLILYWKSSKKNSRALLAVACVALLQLLPLLLAYEIYKTYGE